ncbi:hypothetical protein [Bradyrhizobium sp.]|uniref:hypothetical protein n=1 Tax=Bradyrhizobium sp. TaxID=376 RepID=UPI003C732776
MRRPAKTVLAVGTGSHIGLADLLEKFSVTGEGEDLVIGVVIAGQPDVALAVDKNAVLRLWPIVTRSRAAPISQQVSFLIELQDRRRRRAALGLGRILGRAFFVIKQGRRPMDDPDVIVAIDRNA